MEKIKVYRRKEDYVNVDYSTLKEIKEEIELYIERYGEDATLQKYYEYSDDPHWGVFVEELETDYEYQIRVGNVERQEEYERKQYEKLKTKFDP